MRRINLRKKKRLELKNINLKSKKLLFLFIAILLICLIMYCFFINNFFIKRNFEKEYLTISNANQNIPFKINKIILFSSATANTNAVNQSVLGVDISQYCDIGIYITNSTSNDILIDSLYIDNIKISTPELGTPCLYKKKINDLGKCSFSEDSIIQDNFYFNIINSEQKINYDNYEIYNNSSTPISLGFYNKNVKTNFLMDNSEIKYDGTLLKSAMVSQTGLNCNVSFTINIIANNGGHYISNINFDIPLESEEESIYNTGYVTKEFDNSQTCNFFKIN